MSANTRQHRKPAPKLNDDDADALSVLTIAADPTPARHSFALYPDPLPPTPASPTPSSTGHSHGHSPHYTRRRAQSSSAHSEAAANSPASPPPAIPKSMSTSMAASPAPRTRLARLLLPHAHAAKVTSTSSNSTSSTSTSGSSKPDAPGIRKHTISIPTPATLPAGMLPPELAAFVRAQKPVALRDLDLPPPSLDCGASVTPPLLSPTSTSSGTSSTSGTSSSRASGETAFTSPPRSPLSPWAPTSSCTSPTLPTFAASASPSTTSPAPVLSIVSPSVLPASASVTFAPQMPATPNNASSPTSPPTSAPSLLTTRRRPCPTLNTSGSPTLPKSRTVNRKPPPLPPLLPVSASALAHAARLPLVAPSGVRVGFGEVLGMPSLPPTLLSSSSIPAPVEGEVETEEKEAGEGVGVRPASTSRFVELLTPLAPVENTKKTRRTLVVFLRHFWCPLCQDYVVGLARAASASKDGEDACRACSSREEKADLEGFLAEPEEAEDGGREGRSATATSTTSSPPAADADAAPNPEVGDVEGGEEGEGTHLVLIAPGAHTLAERYLASFGFPELNDSTNSTSTTSTNSTSYSPSTSPESAPPTEGVQHDNTVPHAHPRKRRRRGIASIRLFVDARPQEGVYAALGMGWARGGGASPAASPTSPTSPTAPSFFGASEGGRGSEGLGGGMEALGMESVGFVPGVPLPIPMRSKVKTKTKVGRSMSLPPVVFASAAATAAGGKNAEGMEKKGEKGVGERGEWSAGRGFARGARGGIPMSEDSTNTAETSLTSPSTISTAADTATSAADTAPATDPDAAPTSYITHSALGGVGAVLLRALRAGMPVWERGGDVRLLGGEFVFEVGPPDPSTSTTNSTPTLRCTYAHRMQTTRGHASVARVFAAAGIYVPPNDDSNPRLGRSKSSGTLSRATAGHGKEKEKGDAAGLPRTTSAFHLGVSSTSMASDTRPAVPRSASTPPTAPGMFSRNVFARFAGPKGGRAMQPTNATPKPTTRERAQMPRSASTPPAPAGRRIGALWEQHHGWAHVGVIWEGLEGDRQDKEEEGRAAREGREPAMKATLSASSSRPWALVGAGSSGSIVDDVSDRELEPAAEQGSGSSSSVSISFVSPVRRTGSETTTPSSASEPVSESDLGSVSVSRYQHPHPYAFDIGVGAGKHIYDGAEVWTDADVDGDGDDERSDGEDSIRFAFPKRRSVGYAWPYGDVGELGLAVDGEVSECGAEAGHQPPFSMQVHGRARSEQGGGPLVRVPTRKYATYAGHPHARSRATHGHGGSETEEEPSDEYGEGYEGDGYGGVPGGGEDVWMRARARSLARLKARKEARRGGGV
ncbi:hypothetical protein C8R46DRAFT_1217962 [Mycena filopes]|nr:hypothetical protein C8R46DRAFT_1217962 [Mycena filopes]